MSFGAWSSILRTLTLPQDAGPGTARLVLGPDLPPPLNTYSPSVQFGAGSAYAAAIIWYSEGDDTSYIYAAAVSRSGGPTVAGVVFGHVTSGTIGELAPNNPTGVIWIATPLGVPWIININASQGRIETLGALELVSAATVALTGAAIEISAATTDFDTTPRVGPPGSEQVAYIPYAPTDAVSNAVTSITALTAPTANTIANCVVQVTCFGTDDVFLVTGSFDILCGVAPTSTFNGILDVDGTTQTGNVTYRVGTAAFRSTLTRTWRVTGLAAGARTFTLKGFAGVAAQYATQANNSYILVDPRYSK